MISLQLPPQFFSEPFFAQPLNGKSHPCSKVYFFKKEGGRQVAGFKSHVIDTNGAGDSFWGGFLYQINQVGKRPEELSLNELDNFARFGNAVASLCVEKKGAIPAMPDLSEVEKRVKRIFDK